MELVEGHTSKEYGSIGPIISNLDDLLDELLPDQINTRQIYESGRVIYEILDQVPNGRKSMNQLFYPKEFLNRGSVIPNYSDMTKLQKESANIANEWLEIERQTTSQVTSSTLQIEGPIVFSWTEKSLGDKESRKNARTMDTNKDKESPVRQTTNSILLKKASEQIQQNLGDIETNRFLEKDSIEAKDQEKIASKKSVWANPNFHVDPLKTFIATEIPKEPRKSHFEKKKIDSKRSLFGFWSGRRKKDKIKDSNSMKGGQSQNLDTKTSQSKSVISETLKDAEIATEMTARAARDNQHKKIEFDLDEFSQHRNADPDELDQHDDRESLQQHVTSNENIGDENEFGDFEQASEPNQDLIVQELGETTSIPSIPSRAPEKGGYCDSPLSLDSFIPLKPNKKV